MPRIYAIALNTFREAVRDRVLYGVLAFAFAILLFTLALAELSLNEERRVVLDIGLASISLFSVLVAIFLGSSLLYKEMERKTLYVILPKPIARWEFLVGKYFGISLTGLVFVCIMGGVQLWVTAIQANGFDWLVALAPIALGAGLAAALRVSTDRTSPLAPFSFVVLAAGAALAARAGVPLPPVLAALALTVGEVMVLAAVALLFSSFSTPFLTGVLSFGVWLVGRSADDMMNLPARTVPGEVRAALNVLGRIVPNYNLFVPGRHTLESASGAMGPLQYVLTSLGYGCAYAAVTLLFAALIFRRRDFL